MSVAALTGLVLLEKIGPPGALVARIAGGIMIIAGILLVAGYGEIYTWPQSSGVQG